MIRSMTGYGEAERVAGEGRLRVEIKTVNHRFLNTHFRTPAGFDRFEHHIEGWIRPFLGRGHVNLTVTMEGDRRGDLLPELDLDRARRYKALLEDLGRELGLRADVSLEQLVRFGEIFRAPAPRSGADVVLEDLREVVEDAARAVLAMREEEGRRLEADLRERLREMATRLALVEARAPARLVEERDRLRAAVRELTDQQVVDEDRLARELAYLAEKWDIGEELVRFRSHIEMFEDTLSAGTDDGVGKRLGFIVQEMHREANTIGSKANDAEISHAVVGIKEELERLREQLENVE